MASTSEVGHAKNAATFSKLTTLATGIGNYNPASPSLDPRALAALGTSANAALEQLSQAEAAYSLKVDNRTDAYEPVSKTVTRLGKALKSSDGITKENKATFAILVRKYRGSRKEAAERAATPPPTGGAPELHSVAQLSFDNRVAHLNDIKNLLAALPAYATNEPDLSVRAIQDMATTLDTANRQVITAISDMVNARAARDRILYTPETGLVDIGYKLKNYIGSRSDLSTAQKQLISTLEFVRREA